MVIDVFQEKTGMSFFVFSNVIGRGGEGIVKNYFSVCFSPIDLENTSPAGLQNSAIKEYSLLVINTKVKASDV